MRTVKKRRRKGKTDYNARIKLLKGRKPRIVVRKTNQYVITQYVESEEGKDSVVVAANSKELIKYGLTGSLKSISACYLTGLLLGKKIKEKDKEAILDIGLERDVKKSRIYAVLKGLVDSGIKIKHKKENFPEEKRIKGEHLKNKIEFEKIKERIESGGKN